MHRNNVLDMIKRRALAAGLPETINCHTFRATGITAYLRERRHHRERPGDRGGPSDFRFGCPHQRHVGGAGSFMIGIQIYHGEATAECRFRPRLPIGFTGNSHGDSGSQATFWEPPLRTRNFGRRDFHATRTISSILSCRARLNLA